MRFAFDGLTHGLRTERSLQFHAGAFALVLLALLITRPAPLWWALVMFASASVITAELFNTAIENLTDVLHPEIHPQIRVVKDCAAAAVLITAVGALAVGAAFVIHLL
jgi:diacylglycerol kinase (ATP)